MALIVRKPKHYRISLNWYPNSDTAMSRNSTTEGELVFSDEPIFVGESLDASFIAVDELAFPLITIDQRYDEIS